MPIDRREIEEEILSLIERSDDEIYFLIGDRASDADNIGLMPSQDYLDRTTEIIDIGKNWIDKNFQSININEIYIDGIEEEKLAYSIADMLNTIFPRMPTAEISVMFAREIKKRQRPLSDTPALGKFSGADFDLDQEGKLGKAKLTPIFEGELNRTAMAKALRSVMEKRELSVRKTAKKASTSPRDIQRVLDCEATLDKSLQIMHNLGYRLDAKLVTFDQD